MVFYLAAAVCIVLFVALGRLLVDYNQQSDQLSTTVKAHQRLVDEHRIEIARLQARAQAARKQIHSLVTTTSDLDHEVHDQVAALRDVNDQLERRRPKARRVSKDKRETEPT